MLENMKRELFCQNYAVSGNAVASYRAAGYKPKTDNAAAAGASRLLKDVKIQGRLTELCEEARRQAEEDSIADIIEIRQRVTDVLRGRCELETKASDVIRAGEFLAKLGGQQPEPPTVRVELSLEQKFDRLREIIRDDGGDD